MYAQSTWKKRGGKIFLVVIICFGMALWNPPFVAFSVRTAVGVVALPFQSIFSFFRYHVDRTGAFFLSVGNLKSENERLLRENRELLARNALLADRESENEALRNELGLLPKDRFDVISAEVIGRDEESYGGTFVVNVGESSGVRPGMAVVVEKGVLIGRIVESTPFSSIVRPISHSVSVINAATTTTGARGVVRGEYGLGLLFDRVLQSDIIQEGDEVVTSGLGGDLPQGLFIGTVIAKEMSDDQLFQRATIASPVRVDRLRFVAILVKTHQ